MFLHQSTMDLLTAKGNSQSIWFVNYSALQKMDSLDAMEGISLSSEYSATCTVLLKMLILSSPSDTISFYGDAKMSPCVSLVLIFNCFIKS